MSVHAVCEIRLRPPSLLSPQDTHRVPGVDNRALSQQLLDALGVAPFGRVVEHTHRCWL